MLLDVGSVLKSLNAIESVLVNMFSGVLATVKRGEREEKVSFIYKFISDRSSKSS